MRDRDRIVANLESLYRSAFDEAQERGDTEAMSRLDFDFQKEQLQLEVLLDIRDLLAAVDEPAAEGKSLIEKAEALRRLTRLR